MLFDAVRHKGYVTLTDTRLRCSFTRICVTTHCCLAGGGRSGGRRSRRNTLAGTAISGKPEAFPACTSIAAKCVHTPLGTRLLLAALVHVWSQGGQRCVTGYLKRRKATVHLWGYLFGIGSPSSPVHRRTGWVVRRCLHSHMLSHTRLRGIFKFNLLIRKKTQSRPTWLPWLQWWE